MATDTKTDPNTLIVIDGIRGISRADALKFLEGKRSLLDTHSTAADYLSLAHEYMSINELSAAKELFAKADELGRM